MQLKGLSLLTTGLKPLLQAGTSGASLGVYTHAVNALKAMKSESRSPNILTATSESQKPGYANPFEMGPALLEHICTCSYQPFQVLKVTNER